jgi:hypothetical protein
MVDVISTIIGAVIGAVITGCFTALGWFLQSRWERNARKAEQDQSRRIAYSGLCGSFHKMRILYWGRLKDRVGQQDPKWLMSAEKGKDLPRVAPPDTATARATYHKLTSDEMSRLWSAYDSLTEVVREWDTFYHTCYDAAKADDISKAEEKFESIGVRLNEAAHEINRAFDAGNDFLKTIGESSLVSTWEKEYDEWTDRFGS